MRKHHYLAAGTVACVTGWGLVFSATQHTGVITGLYWAVVTAYTVGYGDVVAHGNGGHLLSIAAIGTMYPLFLWTVGSTHLHHVRKTIRAEKDDGQPAGTDG